MKHCFNQLAKRGLLGFTLIELLIVVAIIAILAAIAVPNFLEAQTRAKVTRAKADIRTITTALEVYRIDNNKYIDATTNSDLEDHSNARGPAVNGIPPYALLILLTTPISYISAVPQEGPFGKYLGFGADEERGYQYESLVDRWTPQFLPRAYVGLPYYIIGVGPTKRYSAHQNVTRWPRISPYDATNGTISTGDILYPAGNGGGGWTSFQ